MTNLETSNQSRGVVGVSNMHPSGISERAVISICSTSQLPNFCVSMLLLRNFQVAKMSTCYSNLDGKLVKFYSS